MHGTRNVRRAEKARSTGVKKGLWKLSDGQFSFSNFSKQNRIQCSSYGKIFWNNFSQMKAWGTDKEFWYQPWSAVATRLCTIQAREVELEPQTRELETEHQIWKEEQELGPKVPRKASEDHDSCSYSTSARDKSLLTRNRRKDIGPVKMEKFKQQYDDNQVFNQPLNWRARITFHDFQIHATFNQALKTGTLPQELVYNTTMVIQVTVNNWSWSWETLIDKFSIGWRGPVCSLLQWINHQFQKLIRKILCLKTLRMFGNTSRCSQTLQAKIWENYGKSTLLFAQLRFFSGNICKSFRRKNSICQIKSVGSSKVVIEIFLRCYILLFCLPHVTTDRAEDT